MPRWLVKQAQQTTEQEQQLRPIAVDTKTAAAMMGMSAGTLENWRYEKPYRGPRFCKLSNNKVVYRIADIEAYLAAHAVAEA